MLANLLKYDTAQGGYAGFYGEGKHTVDSKEPEYAEDGKTIVKEGAIIVDGKEITIYARPKAEDLPWGALKSMLSLNVQVSIHPKIKPWPTLKPVLVKSLFPHLLVKICQLSSLVLMRRP